MKIKKVLTLLSILSLSLVTGCEHGNKSETSKDNSSSSVNSESDTSNNNTTSSEPEVYYPEIEKKEYNEVPDSLEGLTEDEVKDFSLLYEVLSKVENNYTKHTQVFFNEAAISRVNKIYNTEYVNKKTTLYSTNCLYTYDEDAKTNIGYISKQGENKTYQVTLEGDTVEERLSSNVIEDEEHLVLYSEDKNMEDTFFTIKDINEEYISNYGPVTIDYSSSYSVDYLGWTRVSYNKFKCDREEVIKHFLEYLVPGFTNEGTYMTFRYVTIELNVDEETPIRLRLYASPTQVGKLIEEHKKKTVKELKEYQEEDVEGINEEEMSHWYLLFAEAKITDINTTSIPPLENFLVK